MYITGATLIGIGIAVGLYQLKPKLAVVVPIVFSIIGVTAYIMASNIDTLMSLFLGVIAMTFGVSAIIIAIVMAFYHKNKT
ncbi:MAG: hypothetical protein ACOCU2_00145 [Bacillota bacterium]